MKKISQDATRKRQNYRDIKHPLLSRFEGSKSEFPHNLPERRGRGISLWRDKCQGNISKEKDGLSRIFDIYPNKASFSLNP